jgi:hypothetical protein
MIKKLLLSILILLLFAGSGWAATFHAANTGNWTTASTWAENSGYPVAGDTVIFDANSAGKTVTLSTGAACAVLDMTGNTTGVLAMGGYNLNTTGNITLAGSGSNITATSGSFLIGGTTPTITCNGIYIPAVYFSTSTTVTLGSDLLVTGLLKYSGSTMAGAYNISCGTLELRIGYTLTLVAGQSLTVSTAIKLTGDFSSSSSIVSSSASPTSLIYNGTAANQKIAGVTFTNVTVTGTGAPIYNWFGSGTNTGITNIDATDMPCGGGGGQWGF